MAGGSNSALDAAGGKAGNQVLFDGHEQDDNGNDGEDGACEQVLPLDHVVAGEDVDTDVSGFRASMEIRHRATVYSFQALLKVKLRG